MNNIHLDVFTSPALDLANGGVFSPTTSTLVMGEKEVVLVDTQYQAAHVEEVVGRVKASGRTLTTIFITHGHFDHYFGLGVLLREFPDARAVASPAVAAYIAGNHEAERALSVQMCGDHGLDSSVVPEALESPELVVDGERLPVIDLQQADIAPSSIVHLPSIDAVIAGDAIYNGVNPFLAASTPVQWPQWVASVEQVAALNPRTVVAGHKVPGVDDDAACVDQTRAYLSHFIEFYEASENSRELVSRIKELYPDHMNPSALVMSAVTAFKAKKAQQA